MLSAPATSGSVFNNGRDVVGILSVVSGFLMIVPTASGWSLAQLVMLWGASIMGIGSANIMVQTAAENIAEGYSMTVQPVHVSTRTAARGNTGDGAVQTRHECRPR